MFTDQPDQGEQPDLRIDIQRGNIEGQGDYRAKDRHGNRDQNHQGIPETVELCRQDQEDHRQGKPEEKREARALLDELPRLTFVARAVTDWGNFPQRLLEKFEPRPQRVGRHHHALDIGTVELLVLAERVGLDLLAQVDDGREGYEAPGPGSYIVFLEFVPGQTKIRRGLGDDLVAPPLHAETVDLRLAQHDRKSVPNRLHGHAQARRLIAVDGDNRFGSCEFKRLAYEIEEPRLSGFFHNGFGDLVDFVVILVRGDYEINGKA